LGSRFDNLDERCRNQTADIRRLTHSLLLTWMTTVVMTKKSDWLMFAHWISKLQPAGAEWKSHLYHHNTRSRE
jgi:predicted sugar kinase